MSSQNPTLWIKQLYYAYWNSTYLSITMESPAGGDLMTMLVKYDTFSEDATRFCVVECIIVIEVAHDNLDFIHR